MGIYGTIFYGGGEQYAPSGLDVPVDLRFYRTNIDGVYVFHWGFQFLYISAALATLDYELEISPDQTFLGPGTVSYLSGDAGVIQYQNGNVRKGYAIAVTPRKDKIEQIWYARVRVVDGLTDGSWSNPLQFVIPQKWEVKEAENFLKNLPDNHVYGKEDLLKDLGSRVSNLYLVGDMYGIENDQVQLENLLTTTNNFIDLCRDEQLYQNFGIFFDYVKPQTQVFIEYREVLRGLILGSLVGSTNQSIQDVIEQFSGVPCSIELIRDRQDFFLDTNLEVPPESPNGTRTFFSILQGPLIPKSLRVVKNGTCLTPNVDFTEQAFPPGFNMTVAPTTGTLLQVEYDFGVVGDPVPLIFDQADTIALTGTLTFTKGSLSVTGVGTLFTTQLLPGQSITDSQGLINAEVATVNSNTSLTLSSPWLGNTGSGSGAQLRYGEN